MHSFFSSGSRYIGDSPTGHKLDDFKAQLEDDCILPALHDLLGYGSNAASKDRAGFYPEHTSPPVGDTDSVHSVHPLVSADSSAGQSEFFDSEKLRTIPFQLDTEFMAAQQLSPNPDPKMHRSGGQSQDEDAADLSPSGSGDQPHVDEKGGHRKASGSGKAKVPMEKFSHKPLLSTTDRKALAKQRYREKNRKAQARHRERNKKTIEDLSAKNSALVSEVARLKLELAIMSTVTGAKDAHLSKMRRTKHLDLKYSEAAELIREACMLLTGKPADDALLASWNLKQSAAGRQEQVARVAEAISLGALRDSSSPAARELQLHAMQQRNLSLEFAVGNPSLLRSLYAFERAFTQRMQKPIFQDIWADTVERLQFNPEQINQIHAARATLLGRARTIFNERQNIISAVQAGVSEGVADLLISSLEEERQAAYHFLFSFYDEIMTFAQDIICEVSVFPWMPDALALSDIVIQRAIDSSPSGLDALELPSHLVCLKDGRLDTDALATPVRLQVAELSCRAEVSGIAAGLGVRWPVETPLQLLSVPVTINHCCIAGIGLLRSVLMTEEGVHIQDMPPLPLETLFKLPLLSLFKQGPRRQ